MGVGSTSSTSPSSLPPSFHRVRREHVHRAGRSMITGSQEAAFFFFNGLFFACFEPRDTSHVPFNVRKSFKNFHTFYLRYAGKFKIAESVKVEKSFYPGEKPSGARGGHLFALNAWTVTKMKNERNFSKILNPLSPPLEGRLFLSLESIGKRRENPYWDASCKGLKMFSLTSGVYCVKNIIDESYGSLKKKNCRFTIYTPL